MKSGISLAMDVTWSGWYRGKKVLEAAGVPYFRVDVTIRPFVQALDSYLMARNGKAQNNWIDSLYL